MKIAMAHIWGLIIVGLLLVWQDAYSGTWVDIHLGSKHNRDGWYDNVFTPTIGGGYVESTYHEYNEFNPGIGIDHDVSKHWSVGGGIVKNSYHKWTPHAGIDLHTSRARAVQLGMSLLDAPAYKESPADTEVIPFPNVIITGPKGASNYRAKLGIIPGEVVTFTVSYKFR